MASPISSHSDNSQTEQIPDITTNGHSLLQQYPTPGLIHSKKKEKPCCICQGKTDISNIMADTADAWDEESEDLNDENERRIWEHAMKPFRLGRKSQRETAVLMISWGKELDDLHTEEEVNSLEAVFTNLFNYTVIKRQITGDKSPAIQLSKYLSDFVYTYDNESTLLIVYYAGHGVPKVPGGLHFAGNRQPNKKLSNRTAAAWHDVEHIIRDAEGDALLIFDCCYAGNLTLRDVRMNRPTRSFEYIAACGSTDETNFPGPESFTSAIVWALTDFARNQKRFSTLDLQTKIMTEAPFFPRKQSVLLMERDASCDQRLVLAPLPSSTNGMSTSILDELPQNHLDLRLWYLNRPDGVEVENLANRLKRLMKEQNIDACCVSWLGLKSHCRITHFDGDAGSTNNFWMPFNSKPNANQSSSFFIQSEADNFLREESKATNGKDKVAIEEKTLFESFDLIKRGGRGIFQQIVRIVNTRMFSISVFLSLGLYAWHGFPYSSRPFKIW